MKDKTKHSYKVSPMVALMVLHKPCADNYIIKLKLPQKQPWYRQGKKY